MDSHAPSSDTQPTLSEQFDPSADPGATSLERGTAIGRYVILGLVGAGGMGVVYTAYDPELDRKIALKLLRPRGEGMSPTTGAQLIREAQAMARLSHPNVISVHDAGAYGDHVFVAMEFVEGRTGRRWLQERKRSWRQIRDVFIEAGRGLAAAHGAGLVHCDFKPDNIMIGNDGWVKVMDFGLARAVGPPDANDSAGGKLDEETHESLSRSRRLDDEPPSTDPGAAGYVGTLTYLAPEQFRHRRTDAQSDQFAFCVSLYEALYGERPFEGQDARDIATHVLAGSIKDPPRNTPVPGRLRRILLRGLHPDPYHRYPSMHALLADLARDPFRIRKRFLFAGLLVTAIGFGAALQAFDPLQAQCQGGEDKMQAIWGPEVRDRVRRAFMDSDRSYAEQTWERVERKLDAYARRWVAAHQEACEATRVRAEQSEAMLDRRMACLHVRLSSLEALTGLLQQADDGVIENAVQATSALPPLAPCSDLQALQAAGGDATRSTSTREAELREQLAQARVLRETGKHAQALEQTQRLVRQAEAHPGIRAEGLLQIAMLQQRLGPGQVASTTLHECLDAAATAGDDRTAAEAWIELSVVAVRHQGRPDAGLRWADVARWGIDRIGGEDRLEARLSHAKGMALIHKGRAEQAQAEFERALALALEVYGKDHPKVAAAHNNLAVALERQSRYEEALVHNRLALGILERTLGAHHPDVASTLSNLGIIHASLRNHVEAATHYGRALEILEHALSDDHRRLMPPLTNLGFALAEQGELDKAQPYFQRALSIGKNQLPADHPLLAYPMIGMAKVELDQGRPHEAKALLEHALSLQPEDGGDPSSVAEAHFDLARALLQTDGEQERALGLARQARDEFEHSGSTSHKIAEIEAWIDEHS